ncbi:hypothetical protein ABZ778_09525 [Streptomyces bacillaris]|uniref:hypothetical protein n=1 Tax=Streptomyces bacillaris TaxID=68179 RepID=UPI001008085D
MLQCTAVTDLPIIEALAALTTMEGAPAHPPDALPEGFVLCELAEHDETAEHASYLCAAETREDRDLWFIWTGTGAHRVHRFDVLPLCLAALHERPTGLIRQCLLFRHHRPRDHSFFVTDPLRELIAEEQQERQAGKRLASEDHADDA